jgi:hypothetical protein
MIMHEWLQLPEKRRRELLNAISVRTGLPESAIEKDWWVTLALQIVFSTSWGNHLVFKGGTSLSKSWDLIDRFSEDVDLALDREVLGFSGDLSINKIKNLRKASCRFISNDFKNAIEKQLQQTGINPELYILTAQESKDSDRDPQVLRLQYRSIINDSNYLPDKVLIEIGARSLREPSSDRTIHSIIGSSFPDQPFAGKPFVVETVDPKRTFLEKAFLLHEEFLKPVEQIRHERMSRHLYDLDRLMDTVHGIDALADKNLYQSIIEHRKKFNYLRGVDYSMHTHDKISFIPPEAVLIIWQQDYELMRKNMIYGEAKEFKDLIKKLQLLIERFRKAG